MNVIPNCCPGCLQETDGLPCPNIKCRVREGRDNPPPLLPIGTGLDRTEDGTWRYRIAMVLGQGGFGVTYLAWEEDLQQRRAIKEYFPRDTVTRAADGTTLLPYPNSPQEIFNDGLDRFLAEARILARFEQHPGIVSTKAFFRANGTGYMVMEYVEGITMRQHLDSQPEKRIPFERAVLLLTPVMNALQAVHKDGLLHRDIAPDNIYITKDKVKLLDFGAARFATGEQSQCLSVILKPGYAPVEQYSERSKQGPWVDVYALAATLYRAVTGIVPPSALDRLSEDELIPPRFQDEKLVSAAQEAVLLKALAVKAKDRFQSIAAFQQALPEAQHDSKKAGLGEIAERAIPIKTAPMPAGQAAMEQPTLVGLEQTTRIRQADQATIVDLEQTTKVGQAEQITIANLEQTTRVDRSNQPIHNAQLQEEITVVAKVKASPRRRTNKVNWILPTSGLATVAVLFGIGWYSLQPASKAPPNLQGQQQNAQATQGSHNFKFSAPLLIKTPPGQPTDFDPAGTQP